MRTKSPTTIKPSHELAIGDVIQTHGGRFLLTSLYWNGDKQSPNGRGFHSEFLGNVYPDYECSIPSYWRTAEHPWAIQGNEHARWAVEVVGGDL